MAPSCSKWRRGAALLPHVASAVPELSQPGHPTPKTGLEAALTPPPPPQGEARAGHCIHQLREGKAACWSPFLGRPVSLCLTPGDRNGTDFQGRRLARGGGVVLVPMGSAQLPALPSQLLLEELLSESQAQYFKSANIFS